MRSSSIFKKISGDFKVYRWRYLIMVMALTFSLAAVMVLLTNLSLIERALEDNYRETRPAHVTLEMDEVTAQLAEHVQSLDYVDAARAGGFALVRIENPQGGEWYPLKLFVLDDFESQRVETFQWNSGSSAPGEGEMVIERTVLRMMDITDGQSVNVVTPLGNRQVEMVGTVHDPALAPAWQEQTAYGYITAETLEYLTGSAVMDDLKIRFTGQLSDGDVESLTQRLIDSAPLQDRLIYEAMVPPVNIHPHQAQVKTILTLFTLFALLCMILAAVLEANMVNSIMTGEIKYIGILKTLGVPVRSIVILYTTSLLLVSLLSLSLALPLGAWAGRNLAEFMGGELNFTLYSTAVPPGVYLLVAVCGLIIPLLFSLIPIVRACKVTIKAALQPKGVSSVKSIPKERRGFLPPLITMVLGNSFRKKGRLILTLSMLAVAGALFFTSRNIDSAWRGMLDGMFARQIFQLDVSLQGSAPVEDIRQILDGLEGVERAESWNTAAAAPYRDREFILSRTYPDGGHGNFTLRGVPEGSELIAPNMVMGRWLNYEVPDSIVLNQRAYDQLGKPALGSEISLMVEREKRDFYLAGVQEEIGMATAYVSRVWFLRNSENPGHVQSILLTSGAGGNIESVKASLLRELEMRQIPVSMVMESRDFQNALTEHISIILFSLIALSFVVTSVGLLGMGASMGSSVMERRRELGVMSAMGASNGIVRALILLECLIIGALGYAGGFLLSLPLSFAFGRYLGQMAFMIPLSLNISSSPLILWMALVLMGSLLSGIIPSGKALKLTIKETLLYE